MKKRWRGLVQLDKDLHPVQVLTYAEMNAGAGPQPVVCVRCADGPPAVPSVRDVCVRCLAAVWVARDTEEAMTQMRQPELWCMPCLHAHLAQEQHDAQ